MTILQMGEGHVDDHPPDGGGTCRVVYVITAYIAYVVLGYACFAYLSCI